MKQAIGIAGTDAVGAMHGVGVRHREAVVLVQHYRPDVDRFLIV